MRCCNVVLLLLLPTLLYGRKLTRSRSDLEENASPAEFRLKLKAKGFVNPSTTIAEVGTIRVLDPAGHCVNCASSNNCTTEEEVLSKDMA
eukprot:g1044.t1